MKPYSILLYYNYTPIADPETYREKHHLFCIENRILGRIIVASEGLNGAVSGTHADCQRYMEWLKGENARACTIHLESSYSIMAKSK